jgi:predicted ATPase
VLPYVLTGGPGAGKTTLVEALAARGWATTREAGRALIREGVPSADQAAFSEAILRRELESYAWAVAQPGPVLCDRGVPDVVGNYLRLGLPVPAHVAAAAVECPYASPVLVAPPWPEIYVHDAERTHSWETAVATYEAMVAAYESYGYDLLEVPRVPVEERVAFVLGSLGT